MPINFNDIFFTLKTGAIDLAKKDFGSTINEAEKDGQDILNELKEDLKDWVTQLANGSLSEKEFTELVLGQKDEIKMIALKNTGLAEITIDKFKQDILNLIVNTVTAGIKI